jgi:hypothetical protein
MQKTYHCQQRQEERNLSDRWIKGVKTVGKKVPTHYGRWLYVVNNGGVVTDREDKTVITVMKW